MSQISDPGAELDSVVIDRTVRVLRALRSYFRGEVFSFSRLPEGSALLVGNHNAGITMFEPFLLGLTLYEEKRELIHYLGHDAMISMPVVGDLLRKVGVIRAGHESAGEAFAAGRKVMVFPGGNHEAFRPFSQRHRVDFKGRSGFARLALQNGVPIVPVLCLGGHETFFVLRRGARIARWTGMKKLFRSDSFPLFFGLPWGLGLGPIFHLPLPAKTVVEVGEPIPVSEYGPDAHKDEATCRELGAKVEARLQEMMDARASRRRLPILG